MTRRYIALALAGSAWLLGASELTAQTPTLFHISNVTGTERDGRPLETIEEQTEAALEEAGRQLERLGLTYRDVVVSNVFLKDSRLFEGMNAVYRTVFAEAPPTRATVEADLPHPDALIQFTFVATPDAKEFVAPEGLRSPALPYSWGIRVGNTLFVSGATSRDPDTFQPVTGSVPTQTRRIFGNVGMVLEAGGMDYGDLTSCKVFLNDPRRFQEMNGAYAEFVPDADPPARATVRANLVNVAFSTEIQCVAVDSGERSVVRPEARGRSPFSPGIDVGDRVYVAGATGQGPTAADEARAALGRIRQTLEAASLGFDDVEELWVYLADTRDWGTVHEVLVETMGEGYPAPTVIGTRTMGRATVELQMNARR